MIGAERIDWAKTGGLVPAIVQDASTRRVLMLGYMDAEALRRTQETRRVTFFSRTKGRLWEKGETSGNFLELESLYLDCDNDTLLVLARPCGPVCHLGTQSCFGDADSPFSLEALEQTIRSRSKSDPQKSYVARLFAQGLQRMAQKVGEEGVEVALATVSGAPESLREEAADLLFHLLVVLSASGIELADVLETLRGRHEKRKADPSA